MNNTFATKSDAITHGILPALGTYEADYDIDAIADEAVYSLDECRGFAVVEGDEFWAIVAKHDISGEE